MERFKEASGFSWRGLARKLCIDIRLVKRWRKGARPDSANLVALFSLAAGMGLLHLLLPEVILKENRGIIYLITHYSWNNL